MQTGHRGAKEILQYDNSQTTTFVHSLVQRMCAKAAGDKRGNDRTEAATSMTTALKLGNAMWGVKDETWAARKSTFVRSQVDTPTPAPPAADLQPKPLAHLAKAKQNCMRTASTPLHARRPGSRSSWTPHRQRRFQSKSRLAFYVRWLPAVGTSLGFAFGMLQGRAFRRH